MPLVSVETVRRRLRDLPRDRFAAFVAALWTARGAETTTRPGDGVVVARHDSETRTLRPVTGRRVPADATDAEVLVCARPAASVRGTDAHGGRVVDADDVRAMLLYAVPRSAADDLCRRFLDRPLSAPASPDESVGTRVPEYSGSLVVGLFGLFLLVAGVFGGPALTGDDPASFGAPESSGGDPSAEAATPPTTERTPTSGAPTGVNFHSFPPGLGPDGVTDHDALADAHATALTGQSYRLTITHREYVDGSPTAFRRETVFVAGPTTYRTELLGAGMLRRPALVVSDSEAYANGSTRYERRPAADEFDRSYAVDAMPTRGVRNGEGRYADRAERYLGWYLSVSESGIVDGFERDGTRYYWVRLGHDPYPGVENATGSALVDENGVVHEIRREYDHPGDADVSTVVTIRYTDIGSTTVQPPSWFDADAAGDGAATGENATASGTNATASGTNATASETNATASGANATGSQSTTETAPGDANGTATETTGETANGTASGDPTPTPTPVPSGSD